MVAWADVGPAARTLHKQQQQQQQQQQLVVHETFKSSEEQWRAQRKKFFAQDDLDQELRRACREANYMSAQHYLATGASVSAYDEAFERQALHHAALSGDARIAALLLNHGVQVTAGVGRAAGRCLLCGELDQYGYTALHIAAERGHAAFIEILLNKGGASVNPKLPNGAVCPAK